MFEQGFIILEIENDRPNKNTKLSLWEGGLVTYTRECCKERLTHFPPRAPRTILVVITAHNKPREHQR